MTIGEVLGGLFAGGVLIALGFLIHPVVGWWFTASVVTTICWSLAMS